MPYEFSFGAYDPDGDSMHIVIDQPSLTNITIEASSTATGNFSHCEVNATVPADTVRQYQC